MAQETQQPTEGAAQQQQQPQARPCPQDCRKCGMNQQLYCTTQMLFNMSRAQQETGKRLSLLELSIDDIKEQLQPKKEDTQLSIPFAE
jgi:hypothetical protein